MIPVFTHAGHTSVTPSRVFRIEKSSCSPSESVTTENFVTL